MTDFDIIKFKNGSYDVNTSKLFDAFNCLHSENKADQFIVEFANLSLNIFLKNAKEALKNNFTININDQKIYTSDTLAKWLSTHGTSDFQHDMSIRFLKIFNE